MNIIVAASKNMGIGLNNKLPWKLSKDMLYFKRKTIGSHNNLVVMGKNTWLSLPVKPLPYRYNCVLSTTLKTNLTDTKIVKNKSEFESFVSKSHFDNIWIIGGEKIYNDFIHEPYVKKIYLTHIDKDYECDTFFPTIPHDFYLKKISNTKTENNINYQFQIYERKSIYPILFK
jgi:dihydrofolate reductase